MHNGRTWLDEQKLNKRANQIPNTKLQKPKLHYLPTTARASTEAVVAKIVQRLKARSENEERKGCILLF
jgi:hypothetical protein